MKVLIITYYWPPSGGSGVQRWLKFIKYLPDFGIRPIIFIPENPEYAMTDSSLEKEVSPDLEILRGKIWEPNKLLARLGGGQKDASAGFLDSKPSLIARILRFVRANFFIPDARCFWIKPSIKRLKSYLKDNRVDFVITTGPPHSVHLIGLALKRDLGLKWVADFRDPWTSIDYFQNLPLTSASRKKHIRQEGEVVSTADRVVVVGEQMKREFLTYNDAVHVIANGYDTIEGQEPVDLDAEFTLTYAGLMNADRNPEHLWKVLGELASEDEQFANQLKIRIVGSCSTEVLNSIEAQGLNQNLDYLGYQDHEQVSKYQRSAQVLLLTVNRVPSAGGIVTGKIYEYMQARRPVMAIGPVDGDLAGILEETQCGVIADFSDEDGMKKVIIRFYQRFKRRDLNVNSRGIEKYHRRNLTGELFEMLKEM